jgi:hypothetical protein
MMKKHLLLSISLFLIIALYGCKTSLNPIETITDDIQINDDDLHDQELVYDDSISFGDSIISSNSSIVLTDQTLTITKSGTYLLTGNCTLSIIISIPNHEEIILILDDFSLTTDQMGIDIISADKVTINVKENTTNMITSLSDIAIHSTTDLVINGYGSLEISSGKEGINCTDDLTIHHTSISITSTSHGIEVNDHFITTQTNLTIDSKIDGIHVENTDDATKGIISIIDGTFDLQTYGDGLSASSSISIQEGDFIIQSGTSTCLSSSCKGIKADDSITIKDGIYDITSKDDGIHANVNVFIDGGDITISTSDDGIHSDEQIHISHGIIDIVKSYEGIESLDIEISGGTISIKSSDDGINAVGGMDGSSPNPWNPMQQGNGTLTISGGSIFVNASGDGIDINGSVTMSDGLLLVFGPTVSNEGPIDYDRTFVLTGGTVIAIGSSGMAQNVSTANQPSVLINLTQSISGVIHLESDDSDTIFNLETTKQITSILVSSSSLEVGKTYQLYSGGSLILTDDAFHSYDPSADYEIGTLKQTFSITSTITNIGTQSNPRPR